MKKTEDLTGTELISDLLSKINNKTKPIGSLGKLEAIAFKMGCIQKTLNPTILKPKILVFASDHGIAEEGVSLYPREVTYQMVGNFLRGGAAINVFCKQFGIELDIVDAGVDNDFSGEEKLISKKIRPSTRNFLKEKAMTEQELQDCIDSGRSIVLELSQKGFDWLGFGEMGIGNTSSAALLMSEFLQIPLEECVGRGTGHDDMGLQKKLKILNQAKNFHNLKTPNYNEIMQTYGGYEIAMIAGAMIGAYEENLPIVVDGFIVSSAFLFAYSMYPEIKKNCFFSHLSSEKGHKLMLERMDSNPILDLELRLGEGTGAALSYPMFQASLGFLREMASFTDAGVSKV
jgi:nicotinate-nucleotide--dimethylbenzimidazole phosphoribosyltransferase